MPTITDRPTVQGARLYSCVRLGARICGAPAAPERPLWFADRDLRCGQANVVLEMVHAVERAGGREVQHRFVARRPGDVASCWADPTLSRQLLGWQAQHSIDRMRKDAWPWQVMAGKWLGVNDWANDAPIVLQHFEHG